MVTIIKEDELVVIALEEESSVEEMVDEVKI